MTYEPPTSPAGLPPTKVHTLTLSYSDLAGGSSLTVGSRSQPGYALSYHLGTTGGAPPIASDMDWEFFYDGESSPSHALVAIGDSVADPGNSRSTPHHGDYWTSDSNSNAWSYIAYRDPVPYESDVTVGVTNPTSSNSPGGWIMATVADRLDTMQPMHNWRRHADGNEDQAISDGETQTLVSTSGRGRFYGYWFDTDGHTSINQDISVTLDGEASPSIDLNTGFVRDLWRQYERDGSGTFGVGEYDSGAMQFTHHFTPGHMGVYSDFGSSMSVEVTNNGGAGEMDWAVVWDEAV